MWHRVQPHVAAAICGEQLPARRERGPLRPTRRCLVYGREHRHGALPILAIAGRPAVDESIDHYAVDVAATVVTGHHPGHLDAVRIQELQQIQLPVERRNGSAGAAHDEALATSFGPDDLIPRAPG
jgi:hypothetical protein